MFEEDKDEEIRDGLEDLAAEISDQFADVREWSEEVIYFLQALEVQAMAKDRDHPASFEDMLDDLRAAITDRMAEGRWAVQ
ncbi:MAG: hypothetical protein P8Y03_30015 [Anaerolineales bacterium]|jgi:hypothetical protein